MILGIVPARKGSKRLPGKNLKKIGSKTLVEWAMDALLESSSCDYYCVSSDDPSVLQLFQDREDVEVLQRPPELSGDKALAIEYVRHCLEFFRKVRGINFDYAVIVQATSPFVAPRDIAATVKMLTDSDGADSAVSVSKVDHPNHPSKYKKLSQNRLLPYFEEEQGKMADHQMEPVYVRNGAVYALNAKNLEGDELLGRTVLAHVSSGELQVDINTPLEFEFAEFLYNKQQNQLSERVHTTQL